MDILPKIVLVIVIVITICIIVLLIFFLFPFKYIIDIKYDNETLTFRFKYSIIEIDFEISFFKYIRFYVKIFSKTLFNSDEEKADYKKMSIRSDNTNTLTKEIDDSKPMPDDLAEDVKEARKTIRALFASAKKMEAKQKSESKLKSKIDSYKLQSVVDRLSIFIPNDTIYIIKKVIQEFKNTAIFILPNKYKVEVSYGIKDPYIMGLTYAVLVPLSIVGENNVDIDPRFMVDTFKGHMVLSNRFPIICIVVPLLRLLRDKRFKGIVLRK